MRIEFLTAEYERCAAGTPPTRFSFECPKRPGHMCGALLISDNPQGIKVPGKMWHWNGDRHLPTFAPAINCRQNRSEGTTGCGARGRIERGQWSYLAPPAPVPAA